MKQTPEKGRLVPGLGSVRSPGGILGQGWGSRGRSASWRSSPISSRDGHLLSLGRILPTVGTEDHPVELGHTGFVEAVGHTEIRVALEEGPLGGTIQQHAQIRFWKAPARGHTAPRLHQSLTAVQK